MDPLLSHDGAVLRILPRGKWQSKISGDHEECAGEYTPQKLRQRREVIEILESAAAAAAGAAGRRSNRARGQVVVPGMCIHSIGR